MPMCILNMSKTVDRKSAVYRLYVVHYSQATHQIKGTNLVSMDVFKAGILRCLSFNFQF